MQSEARPPIPAEAAARQKAEATLRLETVVDDVLLTWQAIDAALCPIVGQRGVAALYQRSLHLAGAAHPCLKAVGESTSHTLSFEALHAALSLQTAAEAQAASHALSRTFRKLLATLIGDALTERLLLPALNPSSSSNGEAVQDPSP